MKVAEYHANVATLVDDKEGRRLVVYAADGTKVIIVLGDYQYRILEKDLMPEMPCA